jgi:hypothetical protein
MGRPLKVFFVDFPQNIVRILSEYPSQIEGSQLTLIALFFPTQQFS